MDNKLEKALDFANYAHTLHNQKKLIKQKFKDDCVYYYNAGKFTINDKLISLCILYKEDTNVILLDDNEIPIQVKNMGSFTNTIIKQYENAKESYYKEYSQLTSHKSVEGLINE